ncbi:MAG TPA: L-histidine N(alpha)-methyltransferase [Acidiferrobacterales bacterium]|nr:L-histidine N(alpha)-methyltransferase [Acidiferrobacterales bacterium]
MEVGRAFQWDQELITIRTLRGERPPSSLQADARTGLSASPKYLLPKYFYDERGSALFEQICQTPEYYPSRLEDALLAQRAAEIIEQVRPSTIIELGSGSSRKTAHLFAACERQGCYGRYLPLDVCREMLLYAGQQLLQRHPWLEIEALVGDYGLGLKHLPASAGPRLFLFLGGTIGNFTESEASSFLKNLRAVMHRNDRFLLGADRVKETAVLNAAYNDAQGYTAAFNLNILRVLNRALSAEFDLDTFMHAAWYNEAESRIEMHLHSRLNQLIKLKALNLEIKFKKGESVLTEISRKFTPESLATCLRHAGFTVERHYEAESNYFSLVLARPA